MELHEGVIIIAVVAVSSVLFYKVYRFAMRGKTYEEAIAEQRKLPLEHLLLGRSGKDKNKDKKQKKVGKKVKEKPSEKEKSEHSTKVNVASKADSTQKNPVSAVNKSDVTLKASNNTAPSKINVANPNLHSEKHRAVEFEKPEAEVVDEQAAVQPDETKSKKKKKADKGVKPILLNKDEVSPVDLSAVKDEPSSPHSINHFEEKKPKDEFLKRKCSEEAAAMKPKEKTKTSSEKTTDHSDYKVKVVPTTEKELGKSVEKVSHAAPVEAEVTKVDIVSQVLTSAAPQETKRKKKKSDLMTLTQMAGAGGINVTLLEPLIRKSELSRSDIQELIDLLLNKQQESGVENMEWTEGRQDPVMKLRKQLAEKEKALAEEQEAGQGCQVRIRELRAELNTEKSRLNALIKKLEANLEVVTAKLQLETESHSKEKALLNSQLQEATLKLSEEQKKVKAQEEENSAVAKMEQDFNAQRKQLELHISKLNQQLQEEAASIKAERVRLQDEVDARERANILLTSELRKVEEELAELKASSSGAKDEREQIIEQANHAKAEAKNAKNEANAAREMARHLEEELKNASSQLEHSNLEIKSLRMRTAELQSEVNLMKEEKKMDRNSMEIVQKEAEERAKNAELALSRLEEELKSTHQRIIQEKDAFIQELNKELTYYKTEIPKLSETLEIQKKKNDELRHKNWKAMEALTLAENNLKAHLKNSQNVVIEECQKAIMEEQEAVKQFLQRLLPDVIVENVKPHSEWLKRFESSACDYLKQSNLEKVCDQHDKEKEHLQAKIVHYQTIVKDTEAILSKLQHSVEEQEADWAEQLRQKEEELKQVANERDDLITTLEEIQGIQKLKESSETQDKVKELEARLTTEEGEKKKLVAERDGLLEKNTKLEADFSTILSQVANTEHLQKEINSLKNELSTRQEQNEAMSKEVVRLNSLVKIGQASLSQEQLQVKEMEEEIEKLKVQSQNHTATNGPASESTLTESNSKEVKSPSNPVSSSELPNMEKKVKSKKKKTSNQDSVKRRKFSGWFSKKLTSRKKVKNSLSSLSETNKKD